MPSKNCATLPLSSTPLEIGCVVTSESTPEREAN